MTSEETFLIARNPAPRSRLPYLLRLPAGGPGNGPVFLATQETWPGPRDLFCYELEEWPDGAEAVEEVPVQACYRRGRAVHLILRRRAYRRSIFVWTESRGRTLVFWRSERSMRANRPGIRVPEARGLEGPLAVAVDVHERYPWRFSGKADVSVERRALPVGDYGVFLGGTLVAVVERKSVADLAGEIVSGGLASLLAELATVPRAALMVEGRLSDLLKLEGRGARGGRVRPGWLLNGLAALQVAHPAVQWMFAETPKLAADFAYRWLGAALRAEREPPGRPAPAGGVAAAGGIAAAVALPKTAALREAPEVYRGVAAAPLAADARQARAAEAARAGKAWTAAAYAAEFGVSRATARQDLGALVHAGVLRAEGRTRARRYVWSAPEEPPSVPGED